MDKPSVIRNLGPASDKFFARAGIMTAESLRDLGADEAYFRAVMAGGQAHFIGYYALVMGLQGRPWNDCQGSEKQQLRVQFDAIKTRVASENGASGAMDGLEKELNRLGVVNYEL